MSDAPQDAGSNALHIQMRRLGGSTFTAVGLKNADVRDSHPMGAQVDDVDPTGIMFCDANLSGPILNGVNLSGSTISGATIPHATLTGLSIRDVTKTETTRNGIKVTDLLALWKESHGS